MKTVRTLMALIVAGGALAGLAAQQPGNQPGGQQPPAAQQPPKEPAGEPMGDQPGPVHEHMKRCVGEYTTKTVMGGEESTGVATIRLGLDGRFLFEESTSTFMGQEVKGFDIMGYNNDTKEFEAVWTWTMTTGMLRMFGKSDDDGKTITWKASYKDATGEQAFKIVTKHVDDDTFTESMYTTEGGAEPEMVTTYTRKK